MEFHLVLLGILLISTSGLSLQLFFKTQNQDRSSRDATLNLFRYTVPLATLGSFGLYYFKVGNFPTYSVSLALGTGLIILGLLLRWYAVLRLKNLFTVQLAIHENHQLIQNGLFKYIRHPSYLGMITYFLGLGLLMHNYWSILVLLCLPFLAIYMRIKAEETLLLHHFKEEYREYQKHSARLIPFLY